MKILLTTRLPREGFEALNCHELIIPQTPAFSTSELMERIVDCDVLVPTYDYKITKEMIAAANKLKLIANFGVGFNNIDLEAAK
ncbi:MAG: dihydrofolate reductase, partial [Bacteroidales bacterium]|nr:dihydrofolate reductase [Bacteroidales bacterium]